MNSLKPEVSIIMATYNRAHLISETLLSIQNQTFANWECLIIDDGSTDDTKEILKRFLDREPRFEYLKRNQKYKKGLPGCRNMGLDLSKGNYIVFFDDDDIVHPRLLELCVKEFQEKDIDYCRYERKIFFKEFNEVFDFSTNYSVNVLGLDNLSDMITGKLPFNSCQIMWTKKCFNENYFDESLMYAEELELYSRMLSSGIKGISIDKVLFYGRKHPSSNTGEFHLGKIIRRESQIKASLLILANLKNCNIWDQSLEKFFVRMGFSLKSYPIIDAALQVGNSPSVKFLKYKIGYKFYPIIKPIFKLKGKILKN